MIFRAVALLSALSAADQQADRGVDPAVDRALGAWEAKVEALTSFTCRFRQEKQVSFMRRPLVSTGTIAFRAGPTRRLLWKTETPSPGFLSLDASEIRIYSPEFNTLEIVPLQATGSTSALTGAFPGFSGDFTQLRTTYDIALAPLPADSKSTRLRLTPRGEALKKELVAVEITLGAESQVEGWKIVRVNGDELTLTISDFDAGAKLEEKELTFAVPADAKILQPAGAPRPPKDERKDAESPPTPKPGGGA